MCLADYACHAFSFTSGIVVLVSLASSSAATWQTDVLSILTTRALHSQARYWLLRELISMCAPPRRVCPCSCLFELSFLDPFASTFGTTNHSLSVVTAAPYSSYQPISATACAFLCISDSNCLLVSYGVMSRLGTCRLYNANVTVLEQYVIDKPHHATYAHSSSALCRRWCRIASVIPVAVPSAMSRPPVSSLAASRVPRALMPTTPLARVVCLVPLAPPLAPRVQARSASALHRLVSAQQEVLMLLVRCV